MSTYRTSRDAWSPKLNRENSLIMFPESRLRLLKNMKTNKFLIERLNSRIIVLNDWIRESWDKIFDIAKESLQASRFDKWCYNVYCENILILLSSQECIIYNILCNWYGLSSHQKMSEHIIFANGTQLVEFSEWLLFFLVLVITSKSVFPWTYTCHRSLVFSILTWFSVNTNSKIQIHKWKKSCFELNFCSKKKQTNKKCDINNMKQLTISKIIKQNMMN